MSIGRASERRSMDGGRAREKGREGEVQTRSRGQRPIACNREGGLAVACFFSLAEGESP